MNINSSDAIKKLPPYLFVEIDKAKRLAREQGRDIIDLGIGDPDQPTPSFIIEALHSAAQDPLNHRYALDAGMPQFRNAVQQQMKHRFSVHLDADTQILPLIGSKEGIAHFPLAVLNKGNYALVPDPCYPPYKSGTVFAGGKVHTLPLRAINNFLPDFERIPKTVIEKTKLVFVNYPNNPTASVATDEFYRNLVRFARANNIVIISDLAYSEIYFDGAKPRSLLEFDGAQECAIEFHSLSKAFNMTGWRIGWACGSAQLVSLLGKVKSNIDSGVFQAIQIAAIRALESGDSHPNAMRTLYQERRDALVSGLASLGFNVKTPDATFYVWTKIPRRFRTSIDFARLLLEKSDIVATPGIGFGRYGEGYIRFALTVSVEKIKEALKRLSAIL